MYLEAERRARTGLSASQFTLHARHMAHNDFSIELIMRTPLRVRPKGHYLPLIFFPLALSLPLSLSLFRSRTPYSLVFFFTCLPVPFCFTLGILLHICRENCTAVRRLDKGEPSVKRLGNCSSAVGRPAEDDAIFEDNAATALFCGGTSYRFDGIDGSDENLLAPV